MGKAKIEKITYQNSNILSLKIFQRLIALSELNFYDKADLEMRNLYSKLNRKNAKLLLHLSEKLDLAAVQIRLAETFYNKDYVLYISGMYPTPDWPLEEGFYLIGHLFMLLLEKSQLLI